ncbi:hypothetical protein C8F04DRAFT_135556 [Mycena alexandri]|uniref:Uncharacterized protein n=1 Tax=Mycena alexandri TaxID=1745969 RepID=A0AAD6SHE3_9AGAR|nr:hypothetical protein C8F04DRAFT_135556 [Mycena alexandri]
MALPTFLLPPTMTSAISAPTVTAVVFLTAGLIGLEHAASAVLNVLRNLAIAKRFLVSFVTSVVITILFHRFVRIDNGEAEYLVEENSVYLDHEADPVFDGYLDDETGSESDSGSLDGAQLPPRYAAQPRSLALSPSSVFERPPLPTPAPSYNLGTSIPPRYLSSDERQENPVGQISQSYSAFAFAPYVGPEANPAAPQIPTHPSLRHSQTDLPHLVQSVPVQYNFAPKSAFLSEYVQNIPKCAAITPYRYIPTARRSPLTQAHDSFDIPPSEDARFPIATGLPFPNAIPRATPLPRKIMPRRADTATLSTSPLPANFRDVSNGASRHGQTRTSAHQRPSRNRDPLA